jgi:hypothetical protein
MVSLNDFNFCKKLNLMKTNKHNNISSNNYNNKMNTIRTAVTKLPTRSATYTSYVLYVWAKKAYLANNCYYFKELIEYLYIVKPFVAIHTIQECFMLTFLDYYLTNEQKTKRFFQTLDIVKMFQEQAQNNVDKTDPIYDIMKQTIRWLRNKSDDTVSNRLRRNPFIPRLLQSIQHSIYIPDLMMTSKPHIYIKMDGLHCKYPIHPDEPLYIQLHRNIERIILHSNEF